MMHPWPELKWWESGERQAAEEKIHDLTRAGSVCCPQLVQLYKALRATPYADVRCAIIGQDPYPTKGMATGVAFSIARTIPRERWPHTLRILLGEYHSDLGLPVPDHGDLTRWTTQGVLLWNAIPVVEAGKPLSCDWPEWDFLTGEIIDRLSAKGIVFVFLGNVAARHIARINNKTCKIIKTSHPSPRGIRASRTPFTGSRIFSEANRCLVELGKDKIDWELTDVPSRQDNLQDPAVGGGKVLPNLTGANLGGLKRQGTSPNIYTSLAF